MNTTTQRRWRDLPNLGHGVGLRRQHFDEIQAHRDQIDFLEILSENYMGFGGKPRRALEAAARDFPIVLHGVALSIGSLDPLDEGYLDALARLADDTGALWASDHIAYSSAGRVEYHDLIPMPFTQEAVDHIAARMSRVQARIGAPFALENPSYYMQYPGAEMTEAEFVRRVVEAADCGLLLDVNNVYVNGKNHGYDPYAFIDAMPLERVVQIHIAGHWDRGDLIIDTHGDAPVQEVLDLYAYTLEKAGPTSTLLEWDHDVPDMEQLVAENARVRAAARGIL